MDAQEREIHGIVRGLTDLRRAFDSATETASKQTRIEVPRRDGTTRTTLVLSSNQALNMINGLCERAGGLLEAGVQRCPALRFQLPDSLREKPVMLRGYDDENGEIDKEEVYVPDLYWKAVIGWLINQPDSPLEKDIAVSRITHGYQRLGDWHSAIRLENNAAVVGLPGLCKASVTAIEYLCSILVGDGDGKTHASNESANCQPRLTLDSIPPLDKENDEWVEATDIQAITVASLRSRRYEGEKSADGLCGIDRRGRVWRKESENAQNVWYLKSRLPRE